MLYCRRCKTYQHAVCYGIYTSADVLELDHCCGWCAIKYNVPCTSHEIYLFCVRKGKTEDDRRVFVLRLTARRVIISFFLFEFRGYQNASPPLAEFLMVRFELSSTYAERVLYHLLRLNIVEYQPEFRVRIENAHTIFETGKMPVIVYTDDPVDKPSASNSVPSDRPRADALGGEQVPSRPTPSFASQDPIRLKGDSPSSSIKISQETFETLQSGRLPLDTQTQLKAVASQTFTARPPSHAVKAVPGHPPIRPVAALSPQKEKPKNAVDTPPTPNSPFDTTVVAVVAPPVPNLPFDTKPRAVAGHPPVHTVAVLSPQKEKPRVVRQLSPMPTALLSSDDDVGPDPDPKPPVRSPRLDSKGKKYRLVFDWPVNWAKRASRRDDESVYPLDVNEIGEGYVSPLVGQIDEIGKQTSRATRSHLKITMQNSRLNLTVLLSIPIFLEQKIFAKLHGPFLGNGAGLI